VYRSSSFTYDDILNVLKRVRPAKEAGVDDITPRLLDQIREQLCHLIFRKSLDEGLVPGDWRHANVTPIYKKGNRGLAENYRPVNLTSQICKVFENLIRNKIVDHLDGKALLTESQHGLQKGRSCLTNLLSFLEKVTGYVDVGDSVVAFFLGFAKARSDKVPHEWLLTKLSVSMEKLHHGLEGGSVTGSRGSALEGTVHDGGVSPAECLKNQYLGLSYS